MQALTDWISDIKTPNSFDSPNALTFKQRYPIDERYAESERVMHTYADRIPVICERGRNARLASLKRKKFLIPRDLKMGQFMYVIRKHLRLTPDIAIYLYVAGRKIYGSSTVISEIYEKDKDPDGFLYIMYNSENVFGGERASERASV
jgi:GABA(A) receptor-associated protein